jgi:hypothetical protein
MREEAESHFVLFFIFIELAVSNRRKVYSKQKRFISRGQPPWISWVTTPDFDEYF